MGFQLPISTGERRISEPSTASPFIFKKNWTFYTHTHTGSFLQPRVWNIEIKHFNGAHVHNSLFQKGQTFLGKGFPMPCRLLNLFLGKALLLFHGEGLAADDRKIDFIRFWGHSWSVCPIQTSFPNALLKRANASGVDTSPGAEPHVRRTEIFLFLMPKFHKRTVQHHLP